MWVQMKMLALTPIVKRDEAEITLICRYQQVMAFADADMDQARKYRQELLGPNVVAGAPEHYWELAAIHSLGIAPNIWEAMPMPQQAEHIAYLRLSNMAQTVERHETLQAGRWANLGQAHEQAGKGSD